METRTPSKTTLIPTGCDPHRDSPSNAQSTGFVLYVRRSKTDQAGKGKAIHRSSRWKMQFAIRELGDVFFAPTGRDVRYSAEQ
jgi:hypothetical protein